MSGFGNVNSAPMALEEAHSNKERYGIWIHKSIPVKYTCTQLCYTDT